MQPLAIDFPATIAKFDKILERGLCKGVGTRDGQMCVEAAICAALDLPHGDDPQCVEPAVRAYKIGLNDSTRWVSPASRAKGLRDLGIAQIGSRGVVDGYEFKCLLAEETIGVLIPRLFRLPQYARYPQMAEAADKCERERSLESARAAAAAAYVAAYVAAAAAADAAAAAADAAAAAAADAAADAAWTGGELFLLLSAKLALKVLRQLNSPGCAWLDVNTTDNTDNNSQGSDTNGI